MKADEITKYARKNKISLTQEYAFEFDFICVLRIFKVIQVGEPERNSEK